MLRHYWVIAKFVLTALATFLLLLHQYSAVAVAAKRVLAAEAGTLPQVGVLGMQLVFDASLAVLALVTAATLAMYKPRGLTRYGRRLQARGALPGQIENEAAEPGFVVLLAILGAIVVMAAVVHFAGMHAA